MWSVLSLSLLYACFVNARLSVNYDRKTDLTSEATLSWSFDKDSKMFSFGLEITTSNVSTSDAAWVGIGVGEQTSGSMMGADIITAQFDKSVLNSCTTTNRHVPFAPFPIGKGTNSVFPVKDRCQSDRSWKLISCSRDPKKKTFTLEVRRPMEATTEQDRAISAGAQPIMYAYGVAGSVTYHRINRASKRVILVNKDGSYPASNKLVLPDDIAVTFTFETQKYLVPPVRTTYACTAGKMKLNKGEKLYMVAAENIIEKKAHHFIVYGCADNTFTRNYTQTQNCFSNGRFGANDPRAKCTSIFHVWAAGRGPFILPKDVGFPINEESSMIMLETHYDNPDFSKNTRDSSGVLLHFSKSRTIEAGTLQLADGTVSLGGERVKNDFNYTSTCPSSCTNTWTVDKINVFAGFSHMHTTGKYMWTNRYDSKGKFAETITSVAFWTNDHQAGIDYSPPMEVRKGDTLSTTCNFDISKLPNTKFGIETQDEMCIDFLWYYPVQRRKSTHSNNFYCGMYRRKINKKHVTGTLCGDIKPENIDFKATNPSFNDTVGFTDSFGNQPISCPAVLTGQKNSTDGTGSVCFPESAQVNTRHRGVVTMKELQIDDEVEVGGGKYSRVYMFTHREQSKRYEFIELETDIGSRLRLTEGHFLYANGLLKRADEVNVGEYLIDRNNTNPLRVVNVAQVIDKGLYNPQTLHGDIVVNGVLTSTYTHAFNKFTAHAMLAPLRAIHEWLGYNILAFEKDHYLVMRIFLDFRRWATWHESYSLQSLY